MRQAKVRWRVAVVVTVAALGGAVGAQAALVDIGGGMVLDPQRQLVWLQDWNLAAGSAYDDGGDPGDGRLRWESAQAWAENLVYGGHDDWRLPRTPMRDPSCSHSQVEPLPSGGELPIDFQWGCQASELGQLFHQVLGGQPHASVLDTSGDTAEQQANLALLQHLQPEDYWSDPLPAGIPRAWSFGMQDGRLFPAGVWNALRVVAVRDVPEPAMPLLLLTALAAAALAVRTGSTSASSAARWPAGT